MVAEKLERNNVEESLQAVNCLRNPDGLATRRDRIVIYVANNDGLGFAGGDLRECRLYFGVQRVLSHDDDDGHVLIDQSEGTVFKLSGENTLRVHVGNFLDFQSALKACGISAGRIDQRILATYKPI